MTQKTPVPRFPLSLIRGLLLAAAITGGVARTEAELWVYEGFEYFPGTELRAGTRNPDDEVIHEKGFASNSLWLSEDSNNLNPDPGQREPDLITNSSLSYGALETHGMALRSYTYQTVKDQYVWETRSSINTREVPAGVIPFSTAASTEVSDLWISFLLQRVSETWPRPDEPTNGRDYALLQLNPPTGNPPARAVSIGEMEGFDRIGLYQTTAALATPVNGADIKLEMGVTTMIVLHVQLNAGSSSNARGVAEVANLYVNPILGGTGPGVDPIARMELQLPSIRSVTFNSGYAESEFLFDELRIGSTFADVAPVPEPGTALLLGLGAVTVAGWRRRSRSA